MKTKLAPMPFARVLSIIKRSRCLDLRRLRRAGSVCMRWTDANRSKNWDVAEYHAMRRKAVRYGYGLTARRARAFLRKAAHAKAQS